MAKKPEHNEGSAEYGQPRDVPVPNTAGYPNNIKPTQTEKTRGCGAAIKGTGHSKKMG